MSHRLNYSVNASPQVKALLHLSETLRADLDPTLMDLVDIRSSQMNGCTFCLDMHVKEAKLHGERDLRLHHIAAWRESPLFNEREKAALEWTEAITRLGPDPAPDALYKKMLGQFTEKELATLTFAIAVSNTWNRLSIAFRPEPGSFDKLWGLDKAGLS